MPRAKRSGGRSKRDAVLDAAVELLLVNGYDGTSMDAVAARAGVSKTTVYAHYSDKLELFKAVLQHGSMELGERLRELRQREGSAEGSAEDRLVDALVAASKAGTGAQAIAYFRVLIAEHNRRREIQSVITTLAMPDVSDIISIIAQLLVAYGSEHGFEVDRPEAHASMLLRMTVSGIEFDALISDFAVSGELLEAHVGYIVRVFLRGLRPIAGEQDLVLKPDYDYPWGPALG
ncbi:TetR/AcrR family transcriptional regulator [Arthrobacter jiangjiafuii]|uniref:TetR/AcrR family transcriptional regulator n=1 Tax=Arthrobacter jiangjiafuii TaxID=2817475 RepID=A0A975QZG4_9MICC|nr:TetR/AcrR family transcriptional regulator [Arthrobacter jiangjiafuii]MBP3042405.1 TetR/AcrR family transcriptional regulator [Arthrobacter jiangjiafuii]QWC09845.1 TetR/AcrR family transcriptional regulator [Arthrobacter jiangjiafuii]